MLRPVSHPSGAGNLSSLVCPALECRFSWAQIQLGLPVALTLCSYPAWIIAWLMTWLNFMDGKGMTDKYDHVVLAGASHETFKTWHETFWSHLAVAIDLHKIHKVMIIDHRDCGTYKIALCPDHTKDPAAGLAAHSAILMPLASKIKEKCANLGVETYLMAIDGTVEAVKA